MRTARTRRSYIKQPSQAGFVRVGLAFGLLVVLGIVIQSVRGHALAAGTSLQNGNLAYCLDAGNEAQTTGTPVDMQPCDHSEAQQFAIQVGTITHDHDCLSADQSTGSSGGSVVTAPCNSSPNEVWLRDKSGYLNPDSGLCLATPNTPGQLAIVASCSQLSQVRETWTPVGADGQAASPIPACSHLSEGQAVACYAEQEWSRWQSGTVSHETLLTGYTDGAPYEEWCADFISYVYREAGYPFSNGDTDGWDENIAGDVQYQGFVKHMAGSYIPKTGDVAFFNYNGGHVEIVASGGPHPTFIYGNSGTIDPTTGNGTMAANTLTNDGSLGYLVYYLSPARGS